MTAAALTARRAGPLTGLVRAPGDKSISHRALILGALATGVTEVQGLLEHLGGEGHPVAVEAVVVAAAPQIVLVGPEVHGPPGPGRGAVLEGPGDVLDDLLQGREEILPVEDEGPGPQHLVRGHGDQLRLDAQQLTLGQEGTSQDGVRLEPAAHFGQGEA